MTPEDRAKAVMADWTEELCMMSDLPDILAKHIRAAESDAFERAAAKCEAMKPWGNMSDDHAANELQRAADSIRKLKHGA